MCVCVCVLYHMHIYLYLYLYIYIHTHTYIKTYISRTLRGTAGIHIYMHTYIHTYMRIYHIYLWNTGGVHTHTNTHTHMYMRIYHIYLCSIPVVEQHLLRKRVLQRCHLPLQRLHLRTPTAAGQPPPTHTPRLLLLQALSRRWYGAGNALVRR